MAEYQSALIQSLRGAVVPGPVNPGVSLLPNPMLPQLPSITLRRGAAAAPSGNLFQVQPAPALAPYVPPVAAPTPPVSAVVPPPPEPALGPIASFEPQPDVPDYTDDLYGEDVPDYTQDLGTAIEPPDEDVPTPDYTEDLWPPVEDVVPDYPEDLEPPTLPPEDPQPVPDYTEDLWGPEPESDTPAQTFPVQDQPDLQPRDITEDDVPIPDYTQDLWSNDLPVPQAPDPIPEPAAPEQFQPVEEVPVLVPDYTDDLWPAAPEDVLVPESAPIPDYTEDLGTPIELLPADVEIDVPVPDYTDDLGTPIPEPGPSPDVTDEELTQLLLSNFLAEYLLAPSSTYWDSLNPFEADETVQQ
jgi:hypothetical protein